MFNLSRRILSRPAKQPDEDDSRSGDEVAGQNGFNCGRPKARFLIRNNATAPYAPVMLSFTAQRSDQFGIWRRTKQTTRTLAGTEAKTSINCQTSNHSLRDKRLDRRRSGSALIVLRPWLAEHSFRGYSLEYCRVILDIQVCHFQ